MARRSLMGRVSQAALLLAATGGSCWLLVSRGGGDRDQDAHEAACVAFLERELLRFNSEACERFAQKYIDERGYLLHTPRWGTLDGPDDAIETFFNWTLLHSLAGRPGASAIQESAGRTLEAVR